MDFFLFRIFQFSAIFAVFLHTTFHKVEVSTGSLYSSDGPTRMQRTLRSTNTSTTTMHGTRLGSIPGFWQDLPFVCGARLEGHLTQHNSAGYV